MKHRTLERLCGFLLDPYRCSDIVGRQIGFFPSSEIALAQFLEVEMPKKYHRCTPMGPTPSRRRKNKNTLVLLFLIFENSKNESNTILT